VPSKRLGLQSGLLQVVLEEGSWKQSLGASVIKRETAVKAVGASAVLWLHVESSPDDVW